MAFVLTEKARFKVGWGGRDAAKSWNSKAVLLVRSMQERINVLCTRQVQDTISQSVHKLIVELIAYYKLSDCFHITDNKITCRITGSEFTFKGLAAAAKDKTALKMLNFIDVVDIEEGESLEEETFNALFPSIRKEGSEIWIWFNTTSKAALGSFVYKRFVADPPKKEKCIVKRLYYWDNPHLSQTSKDAIEETRVNNPDLYKQIYLGDPDSATELLYPKFKESVHVRPYGVTELDDIFKHGNFFCAMDPHKVYYPFVLWGVKYPIGSNEYGYLVYNEFPYRTNSIGHGKFYHEYRDSLKFPMSLKELTSCIQILDSSVCNYQFKVSHMLRSVDPYFADGAGGKDWSANTEGLISEWVLPDNGGLKWTMPDRKEVRDGREDINRCLDYNQQLQVNAFNDPHLHVLPHCLNLIDALRFHRYDFDKCREDPERKCISDTARILFAVMTRANYRIPDWVQKKEEKPITMRERYNGMFFNTKNKAA